MATPTQQPSNPSELQLYRVLQRANLLQYYDTFISQGGDDVQQLCEAGEDEFLEIMALVGMASKPLHVRRLQKALQAWVVNPAAFEGNVRKAFPTHVHSMTGSSSQTIGHTAQSLSPTAVTDMPISSVQQQQQPQQQLQQQQPQQQQQQQQQPQQQDFKVTPPQSSTISTSTPWSSAPTVNQGLGSPSEHSSREQPSPTDSQEEEFKDLLFSSDPGQSYNGGVITLSSFGQPMLLEHQITAIATAAALLAQELPSVEPKSLPKKQMSKEINMVMSMSADDPVKMDALRKYAAIYGRFDSKRKNDRPMSLHEISVNEAAAQLCSHLPALLTRREELFPLARQVVRDSGYQYSKGHSRAAEIVPTKTEPPGDGSDTGLAPSSPSSNGLAAQVAPAVSPLEDKLIRTQNELTDVTSNLSELSKEQERIRSALRVLLEAKDHTQMSALTAEMDTINDRYARLTTRRQELVGQLASLRRQSPKMTSPEDSGQTPDGIKTEEKHNKHHGASNINNNNDNNYSNISSNNSLTPSNNSLNALYMAAALQNSNEGSLLEEGLRIATQYGMSDFAQELMGMKSSQQSDNGDNSRSVDNTDFIVGEKIKKLKAEHNKMSGAMNLSSHQSSANSSPGRLSSPSPLSITPSRSLLTNTASLLATNATTINIVSGIGFQQYVSSPTTTTQQLKSLDTIKTSKMSSGTPTMSSKDNITRSPNISSPEIDNKDKNSDDFITLSIPTTSNPHFAMDDSPRNTINPMSANSDINNTFPNTLLSANNINTSPSKPVEVEMTRRSSRKRNTDPDYYLINGGEKRFRSNPSRRSSSTSSERNAKGAVSLPTAFTSATTTASTSPPSSSSSSPSSFSPPTSIGKISSGPSPSPSKGHIIVPLEDPVNETANSAAGRKKERQYNSEGVDISDDESGSRCGRSSVEDWVSNNGDAASISLLTPEEGVPVASVDELGEEGEKRVGRRKRNQPVVSYTAFR